MYASVFDYLFMRKSNSDKHRQTETSHQYIDLILIQNIKPGLISPFHFIKKKSTSKQKYRQREPLVNMFWHTEPDRGDHTRIMSRYRPMPSCLVVLMIEYYMHFYR